MAAPFIERVTTTRLDIPLVHPITMSFGVVRMQNIVIVRLRDSDGAEGIGEASVLGGPHWNEESAEGIQAVIENYIAPALRGVAFDSIEAVAALLGRIVCGNASARAAVEMAALDLLGKRHGIPACQLLGGPAQRELPVAWTLSTGETASDIAEGERAHAERGHARFKLKFGRENAASDVARALAIIDAFRDRATVIADVNQAWDEVTAARYLPYLEEAGLEAIEQPLPAGDLDGVTRLRAGLGLHVIADESLSGPKAALRVAAVGGASVFSLKPGRDGGACATRKVAGIASAAGIGLYGGTMLESSIGTAASAHIFAALPDLAMGCELFGPLRLAEDIVTVSLLVSKGVVRVPDGPGLGIELDEDRIRSLARWHGRAD